MRINIHFDRAYAIALNTGNLQPGADVQRRNRVFQELLWHSRVDQRTEEHVAAHAGKTIEVGYAHRSSSAVVGLRSLVQKLAGVVNDQRQTANFHDREACTSRQTAAPRALCYNHCFRQALRGILVSSSGTSACPANSRVSASKLRSRFTEDSHRAAASNRTWRICIAPCF